jgi:hypothetical protein
MLDPFRVATLPIAAPSGLWLKPQKEEKFPASWMRVKEKA